MKKYLLLIAVLLIAGSCFAKYTQTCQASFLTERGWSKKYTVEVTFMTGHEMNEAIGMNKYAQNTMFAVIAWDKSQKTVIKLSNPLPTGYMLAKESLTHSVYDVKGKDQNGGEWKISAFGVFP